MEDNKEKIKENTVDFWDFKILGQYYRWNI